PAVQTRTAVARSLEHRPGTDREARIAVWDVDSVFPALAATVRQMNDAQAVFGFEPIAISVPLDVWDLNRSQAANFLWAQRLPPRRANRGARHGVAFLGGG